MERFEGLIGFILAALVGSLLVIPFIFILFTNPKLIVLGLFILLLLIFCVLMGVVVLSMLENFFGVDLTKMAVEFFKKKE